MLEIEEGGDGERIIVGVTKGGGRDVELETEAGRPNSEAKGLRRDTDGMGVLFETDPARIPGRAGRGGGTDDTR